MPKITSLVGPAVERTQGSFLEHVTNILLTSWPPPCKSCSLLADMMSLSCLISPDLGEDTGHSTSLAWMLTGFLMHGAACRHM